MKSRKVEGYELSFGKKSTKNIKRSKEKHKRFRRLFGPSVEN